MALSDADLMEYNSKYLLPECKLFFSDRLADKYKPVVYNFLCQSGSPMALYYRIVAKDQRRDLCIQYFFYWDYQNCMGASHRYDYEPIFVYLKNDSSSPQMIVNGGFSGPQCGFHINEIRPVKGERNHSPMSFSEKMCPEPYYPFGKGGNVNCEGCATYYPLDGDDLTSEDTHPLFGIIACSNVFSGGKFSLRWERFNPPLKRLDDSTLDKWYFHHHDNREEDMPFGHDIANPFSYPYIKYHSAR
jgi:hypothetical protein